VNDECGICECGFKVPGCNSTLITAAPTPLPFIVTIFIRNIEKKLNSILL
jgi:hypothetical protein